MKKYLRFGRKVLLSLSAVLVLMIACSESTNDPVFDNTVAGILVDNQGMAVPHAFIEAFQKTENFKASNITNIFDKDTTDEDGKFELSELPDDLSQVGVRITHPDFAETNTDLETLKGENDKSNIRIVMNQRDDCVGKIEITVRDKNGTPLSDVKVKLSREGQTIRHSETDIDGKLLFENVCPGGYWLRFYKEGYTVKEDDIRVPENDSTLIEFAVVLGLATEKDSCCEGSIKIYPVDEKENPITNAKVKIWQDGELLETKEVNRDGFALFENLCEGKYAFDLIAEGYKSIEFLTELGCNEDKSIYKMLISDNGEKDSCCDGKIYLMIKDEVTKKILEGAHVTIWKDGDKLDTKIVDGEYVLFENLCEG
ncbi:MAG: carboxypeptidase regulatory-like domain-containing protein, partial [Chlorobi bacterium]|nr:carboxypeptidase regulatory-like domain-containing protein [Chlorobiota bacterium]